MYAMGIPIGIFIDSRGPRPAVLFGSLMLAGGYFPLRQAYISGQGSMFLLCLFSFCTGLGGCAAFAAAIKTSALNWPRHRGTATAFPLAAFGLSAFFFSIFSQFVFSGETGDFLLLLSAGTSGLTFVAFFFLRVLTHASYAPSTPHNGLTRPSSNPLRRTRSEERKLVNSREAVEPGKFTFIAFKILCPHRMFPKSSRLWCTCTRSSNCRYERDFLPDVKEFFFEPW